METLIWTAKPILYLLGTFAIVLTTLPLFRFSAWWVRIGEFPRLQIAAVCVVVLSVLPLVLDELTAGRAVFLILLAASAVYQFYRIVPYLFVHPKQVELSRVPVPRNVIRLLISNVLISNRETDKLLRLIEKMQPDIVLLAETDEYWVNKVAKLKKTYPFAVEMPLDNAYGIALYSRLELVDAEIKFLVEEDIPSIHTKIVMRSGKTINLYCLHPRPPGPTENFRSLERDAELLMVGRAIDKLDVPVIVAGDLNDVAWSWTTRLFQRISGLLDPRIGRGLYTTFPVGFPLVRCPLDHVFHSNHFRLVELRRLSHIGSDHFPMYIALSLETTAQWTQEEPDADAEEHAAAKEMIEEAFETLEEEKRAEAAAAEEETDKPMKPVLPSGF